MIGIIFQKDKLKRLVNNREVHENISFYYQLAEQYAVNLLFYSLWGIRPRKKKVVGYLYSYQDKTLTRKMVDMPKINMLRTIIVRKKTYRLLKKLEEKHHLLFINMIPERNKWKIYKLLSTSKELQAHIPTTYPLNKKNFKKLIQKYQHVVIKPINGARGEKIYKVSRDEQGYTICYTTHKKQRQLEVTPRGINLFLKRRLDEPRSYLVQKWINFQELEGNKFDIRVSVQKDKRGEWIISGMVVRQAAKDGIVTNIAQGGKAVSFQQIKSLISQPQLQALKELSIKIAKEIEKYYPSTADLGLDMAFDQQGKLWFIEANHCDEKYAYYEARDLDLWQASYSVPFEYAYAEFTKD